MSPLRLGVDLVDSVGKVVEILQHTSVAGNRFTKSDVGTLIGTRDVWKNDEIHSTIIFLSGASGLATYRQIELPWGQDSGRMGVALESVKWQVFEL